MLGDLVAGITHLMVATGVEKGVSCLIDAYFLICVSRYMGRCSTNLIHYRKQFGSPKHCFLALHSVHNLSPQFQILDSG